MHSQAEAYRPLSSFLWWLAQPASSPYDPHTVADRAKLVIVGAGCSGLSLAVQLARHHLQDAEVLILDPKTTFTRDRTWCFFGLEDHPFRDVVSHRWHRWSVIGAEQIVRESSRMAYEHLPADAFYDEACRIIGATDNIELKLGHTVTDVIDHGDHVVVKSDRGDFKASMVFDSRPSALSAPTPVDAPAHEGTHEVRGTGDVRWVQHFLGWFVKTPTPAFDPAYATLMDFTVDELVPRPAGGGIHFMYVLPFSETEALVEDTYFSARPLDGTCYEQAITAYLDRLGVHDYEISEREQGQIPMTTQRFEARPSPRVYRLGVAAGLARPSTGYAFSAIQRYSEAMATAILDGQRRNTLPTPPTLRGTRATWLDRVFLSYLHDHPDQGPALFCQLFRDNPPERLARFLSETSSPVEDAQVMQTLPGSKLAPEAAKTILRRVAHRALQAGTKAWTGGKTSA